MLNETDFFFFSKMLQCNHTTCKVWGVGYGDGGGVVCVCAYCGSCMFN